MKPPQTPRDKRDHKHSSSSSFRTELIPHLDQSKIESSQKLSIVLVFYNKHCFINNTFYSGLMKLEGANSDRDNLSERGFECNSIWNKYNSLL